MAKPNVTGQRSDFQRVRTGLPSLDLLVANQKTGELGYPVRTISEIYGYPGHGKSTLVQFLAGKLSSTLGYNKITVVDLENAYDETHLVNNMTGSGFEGEIYMVPPIVKGEERSHEVMLDELISEIRGDETGVGILDSIGASMSQAEIDNPIGSANWGKRSVMINQVMRKLMYYLRNTPRPKAVLCVNHQYPEMGGRGHTTPGGEGKEFAVAVRLTLWKAETFGDGVFVVKLKAEKMRYGGTRPKATASVVIIPGIGVSPHLTVMIDAINAGLVERTKAGVIKLDGKSLGRIGTLTQKAADGKLETFDPIMPLADKITLGEDDDTTD